jgi:L-alanine-DL-glutamate epimerase-like enolase superfamily enzyme
MLEQSFGAVAEEGGYRLLKLRRSRSDGTLLIELDLAGPAPPNAAMLQKLRETAGDKVRVRVRTLLETEL